MQVSILGPVRIGPAGAVPGAGMRALLARLALAPGRVVGVETIVDDVWPSARRTRPTRSRRRRRGCARR